MQVIYCWLIKESVYSKFCPFMKNLLISILLKSFSLPRIGKQKKALIQKLCPRHAFLYQCLLVRLGRNGLKNEDSILISGVTCAIYGSFCILVRFLVLIQMSVVIMIRYSENLLCLAICNIYIYIYIYMKNLGDGQLRGE